MSAVESIRAQLPDAARDIKLNLQAVLEGESTLSPGQRWGVAVASALAARNPALRDALLADARAVLADAAENVIEDASASAAIMAMNNVYYRFRHMVGKESYATKSPRLRMNRIGQPRTNKADFELMCLAVSAINGCETCVKAHEKTVSGAGITEDQVNDAVRIASTVTAAAVALELTAGAT
jgi:lipoyl-dependent peroxiredoxin subunit D